MTSFLGLLKKDAKVSWIWLAVWLCGMICWALAAHVIAARQKEPLVIFGFFAAMGFFQFLVAPLFMYYHLHKEGKKPAVVLQSEWRILSAGFQADGLAAVSVDRAAGAYRLRHLDVPDAFCKRSAGTHHSPGRHINRTECLPADQFSVLICDRGRILDCFSLIKTCSRTPLGDLHRACVCLDLY